MKCEAPAAVGKRVADIELRVLLAFIRLNRKAKGVMSFRSVRLKLQRSWQGTGLRALSLRQFDHSLFRQHDFKALRAPLRPGRRAGVVNEVALQHVELA